MFYLDNQKIWWKSCHLRKNIMYSKENVRTISHGGSSSSDESILDIENFSPIETFAKNINYINEKYNGQFNKTEVLLTLYPVDNKKVAIITFRDMSSSDENNLLMYLTTEKDAKRLIPNIQMAVDQNKKLSNGEMMACLSSLSNFRVADDLKAKRDPFGIDPVHGIETLIMEDFYDNFTEQETQKLITKAYDFFLDNKDKSHDTKHKIKKIKKNRKEFGVLISYDQTKINSVMFGTYQQVSTATNLFDILKSLKSTPKRFSNEDEQIEELKKLLEEYDCEDELEDIEDLDKWEQIQELEELLREYRTQKNANEQIEKFKSLVTEYKHDLLLPTLPKKPHGSLFGIGFIYDEDMDTRVLMAIELLKDQKNIVAVYEHKGIIEIYSKDPCKIKEIIVCNDIWPVYNYVPKNGKWIDRSDIMSR